MSSASILERLLPDEAGVQLTSAVNLRQEPSDTSSSMKRKNTYGRPQRPKYDGFKYLSCTERSKVRSSSNGGGLDMQSDRTKHHQENNSYLLELKSSWYTVLSLPEGALVFPLAGSSWSETASGCISDLVLRKSAEHEHRQAFELTHSARSTSPRECASFLLGPVSSSEPTSAALHQDSTRHSV